MKDKYGRETGRVLMEEENKIVKSSKCASGMRIYKKKIIIREEGDDIGRRPN